VAIKDDYSWVRGANYNPSYAANSVEVWKNYDPEIVARELSYAERLELNSVRVFLQYLVYEHQPEVFLKNVATFVDLCEKHHIRPMLVLFDSCFSVSPSMENGEIWVANPGPLRTNPDFYPQGEKYIKALVELFRDDPRVLMWDIMNEPTVTYIAGTKEGRKLIWEFVRHFCNYIHTIDKTHPITVGVAGTDTSEVTEHIDVLSMHSYDKDAEAFRKGIQHIREQAEKAGKPFLITECCAPGWGNNYEMVMPTLREEKAGYYFWEVMIGNIRQFRNVSGLVYPDGTARRLSQITAVLGRESDGFTEKTDDEGFAINPGPSIQELLKPMFERFLASPCDEERYAERYTMLKASTQILKAYGDQNDVIQDALKKFDTLRKHGQLQEAFDTLDAAVETAFRTMFHDSIE